MILILMIFKFKIILFLHFDIRVDQSENVIFM